MSKICFLSRDNNYDFPQVFVKDEQIAFYRVFLSHRDYIFLFQAHQEINRAYTVRKEAARTRKQLEVIDEKNSCCCCCCCCRNLRVASQRALYGRGCLDGTSARHQPAANRRQWRHPSQTGILVVC